MKRDKVFPMRVSAEDIELVEAYRKQAGLRSHADAFREALKNDAARLSVSIPKPAAPKKRRTPRS